MSFRGTRRTDGPDKPLDSSRDILCPTGRENITFPVLVFWHKATSIQFDGSHFFSFFLFFFSPEYLCLATDDFFSTGGSKENLFYHGRADRYQASNRYFPFVRRPFEPPLLPRPSSKLILTISICDSLSAMPPPPFTLFDPCLRRQTEGHAPTIMADRDSLAFHFLYFISLSLCPLCSVIFEKHHALFRPPPIKHNSNIRTCSMLRDARGEKIMVYSLPSIIRFHVWSREF